MYGKLIPRNQKSSGGQRAQAIVEFAIVLPVLLVLLLGVVEVGRILIIYASVTNASREAVRFGSAIGFHDTTYIRKYQYCSGIRDAAKRSSFLANVQNSNIRIYYDSGPSTTATEKCTGSSYGATSDTTIVVTQGTSRVKVTVTATYTPITSLLPISSRTITSTSARTILGYVDVSYP